MAVVALEEITLFGRHGYYTAEEDLGSHYRLDAYISYDISRAGGSDDLHDAVNYEVVYERCVSIFHERHKLLEALAYKMAHTLVDELDISGARIRITKLHPPLPGVVGASTVDYATPGFEL